MMKFIQKFCLVLIVVTLVGSTARADEVVDWNQTLFRAALVAGTTPLVTTRVAAIVQAAVFDAVNGIERRYTPIHVPPAGPAGASRDAAAAKAAYTALVALYPLPSPPIPANLTALKNMLDARLAVSMAIISARDGRAAAASGAQWGETVANAILAWRSTDHFTDMVTPFMGGTDVGNWRPTPPGNLPGSGPQFAYMTTWVIDTHSQFRPAGPAALTSTRYTTDFNETKTMGSLTSTARTPDQTVFSWFWASSTSNYIWNNVAAALLGRKDDEDRGWKDDEDRGESADDPRPNHRSGTLENARLFALLNLAMADAAIGCWDAKYWYWRGAWRPITAIRLADTDGNPATIADPGWSPLFATPAHPEYPSGHSCVSGAAGVVLADYFGEKTHFTASSDTMPGVMRSFKSFSSALEEVKNARIFAGIHFRLATDDGQALGRSVAEDVLEHGLQPVAH
jgi:hypothetical protein